MVCLKGSLAWSEVHVVNPRGGQCLYDMTTEAIHNSVAIKLLVSACPPLTR